MKSKDFDFTTVGFDTMLKTEVLTVKVSNFAKEAARLKLTVDRITGIFLNEQEGILIVPFITGTLDAKTKGKTFIVTPNLPALMSWTNVYDMYTFGISSDEEINIPAWMPVLEQIKNIKDKNGRIIEEFYGVGYAAKATGQFLRLPDKRVMRVNPPNRQGITSLRYDFVNGKYFGIRLNERGIGTGIISIPFDQVIKDPTLFLKADIWDAVAEKVEPAIISLSRVKIIDGFTTFYTNHINNFCNQVTLSQVADEYVAVWEKAVHTPVMLIGTVASSDLYAGYRSTVKGDMIEVFIEKPDHVDDFPFISLTI
jgi:hypothetical protein